MQPEYYFSGIHINCYAEVETDLYNPCISGSRMGVPLEQMEDDDFAGLDGIHFHTMCEQNSDVLERTLDHMLPQFDKWLKRCKWVNFGGGHHHRPDYDVERLVRRAMGTHGHLRRTGISGVRSSYSECRLSGGNCAGRGTQQHGHCHSGRFCRLPYAGRSEMPYRPHILYSGTAGEKLIPPPCRETPALPVM